MRILVREADGELKWYSMKEDNDTIVNALRFGEYRTENDEYSHYRTYRIHQILKIEDDFLNKYVVCNYCGTAIVNTPEAIEAHYNEQEAKANCFECRHMAERNVQILNETRYNKVNDEGQYEKTTTKRVTLICNANYMSETIDDAKESGCCVHYKCRLRGVKKAEDDFLHACPNFYDKMVSEKALVEAGWTRTSRVNGGKWRRYKSPEGRLTATCDQYGIVFQFDVSYRKSNYAFHYSPDYGVAFIGYGMKYLKSFKDELECSDVMEKKIMKELDDLNV